MLRQDPRQSQQTAGTRGRALAGTCTGTVTRPGALGLDAESRWAGSCVRQGSGIGDQTPQQKWLRVCAPEVCLPQHCWPGGRSLPEVVHLAEDFLVLDVAAVLLPQRRATHGALQAPHVPDEVVDLGRGRGRRSAQPGLFSRPAPVSLASFAGRVAETQKVLVTPLFSSVILRLREIYTLSTFQSEPGA
jgi:hypothetical protein